MAKIYLDLDGTVADFHKHFNETIENGGLTRTKFDRHEAAILKYGDWWLKMPPLPDHKELMKFLKNHDVSVLSAAPQWDPDAVRQKTKWAWKHLGIPPGKVIVKKRSDKSSYAADGHFLIDDFDKNIREWQNAGGTGILHTSAKNTIFQLKKHGIS